MKRMKRSQKLSFVVITCFVALTFLMLSDADAALRALWDFENHSEVNDSNLVFYDVTGHGNNGFAVAGPNDPCSPVASKLPKRINRQLAGNKAIQLGKPDSGVPKSAADANRNWNYVQVPYSASIAQLGPKWTIAFWLKQYTNDPNVRYLKDPNTKGDPSFGSGYQRVISCPNYEIELGIPYDLNGVLPDMNDWFWPYEQVAAIWQRPIGASQSPDANSGAVGWHHFALTYDGTTLTRYTDGKAIFTANIPDQALPNNFTSDSNDYNSLEFGNQCYPLNKDFLIGALDDIAIFSNCLSGTDVNAIKDGNFAGPWPVDFIYEDAGATTYILDPTFIAQKNTIALNIGQKKKGLIPGIPSWNWGVKGDLNDVNLFGLVNAGAVDGDTSTAEYAAYTTVNTMIVQPIGDYYGNYYTPPTYWGGDFKDHWRIHKNTKYDFKTRFAGENAVGNIVGVRLYTTDVNDPNIKTLLTDMSQTVADNNHWYSFGGTFTADEGNYPSNNKVFYVECYINQGTGNPRGTAFGWFDYVRIDVNSFLTCEALYSHYNGVDPCIPYDLVEDCRMNFKDFAEFAESWADSDNPEPIVSSTELLTNADFYADINKVPLAENTSNATPKGWSFVPATSDGNKAGIWNVSDRGKINAYDNFEIQPAGGSVAAYIGPNEPNILQQVITSPTIVNGQTYYLSAMLGGLGSCYLNQISMIYEYVDNPTTPTTVTQIARQDYVLPSTTVWRRDCNLWTAPPEANGKWFRVRAVYGLPSPGDPNIHAGGWGLVGSASVNTLRPQWWQRSNLLINGDFENISNQDDANKALLYTEGGWTWNFVNHPEKWPPGWTFYEDDYGYYYAEGGLQCMYWAPAPQPAHKRVSLVIGHDIAYQYLAKIEQTVTSETIQPGQTYYLDFIGCISASNYNLGIWNWPVPDPNIVAKVYWVNPGKDIHTGTKGTDWNDITILKKPVDGGMGARYRGHWQTASKSFTIDSGFQTGRNFVVEIYGEAPWTTIEEIYLSKEPFQTIGAYTCGELRSKGATMEGDFNNDCIVDFKDLKLFVDEWLFCNDPAGCQ
ncbi:MAG: LamG-like jellyroll fold domain-containing protein [Sedimentisphaerales bacterium]